MAKWIKTEFTEDRCTNKIIYRYSWKNYLIIGKRNGHGPSLSLVSEYGWERIGCMLNLKTAKRVAENIEESLEKE